MVDQTERNQMQNKIHFLISYDVMLKHICAKIKFHNILKK
jgi:hypothetical protein